MSDESAPRLSGVGRKSGEAGPSPASVDAEVLRAVMEGTSRTTGEAFFRAMVENLARALDVRCAMIGCLDPDSSDAIETRAVWMDGALIDDFRYPLAGSPCEQVLALDTCFYPDRVQELFPKDSMLREMAVECYVGTPLRAALERRVGVLVVMDDRPMEITRIPMARMVLEIFASRASAELDRLSAHRALLEHKLRLEEVVEERTAELERSNLRLERTSRLASLGTLASGIAHEINNPLGVIRLVCESLGPEVKDPAEWGRARKRILESVDRCKEIVRGIRRFALDERSQKTWLDIDDCVLAAVDLCAEEALRCGVRIQCSLAGPLPVIRGNATELQQLLVNLIHNALHSPGVGRVRVRSGSNGKRVQLDVEDDGAGIPEEHRPRIFDPFYTTRAREGGMGMGLSICHGIVLDHGGEIDIDSPDGSGCRVRIELPLERPPPG